MCSRQEYGCQLRCQQSDGVICAGFVWSSVIYTAVVTIYIVSEGDVAVANAVVVLTLIFMAMWSHFVTMTGDPGVVPYGARPLITLESSENSPAINMCGYCDNYKPPGSHHDKKSINRCISRMDHYCPWMNNVIGAKNQKNFFLFLIYLNLATIYMYIIVALHMVDCGEYDCFNGVSLTLVRVVIFLLLFGMLFTLSMMLSQAYGLSIGMGTVDRMQNPHKEEDGGLEPVPWGHVFGTYWPAWFLPIEPVFHDDEEVLKYKVSRHPAVKQTAK